MHVKSFFLNTYISYYNIKYVIVKRAKLKIYKKQNSITLDFISSFIKSLFKNIIYTLWENKNVEKSNINY